MALGTCEICATGGVHDRALLDEHLQSLAADETRGFTDAENERIEKAWAWMLRNSFADVAVAFSDARAANGDNKPLHPVRLRTLINMPVIPKPKWFAISHTTRRIIASGATYRACSEAALLASGWTMEAGECAPYAVVGAAWFRQTQEGAQA